MSDQTPGECDVVIVGLGPVGSVLAILIAQLGHDVIVLERWERAYPLPRAVHFDGEVARILQSCGVGPLLGEITELPDTYEWRNATGETLLNFTLAGDSMCGWPNGSMFHQPQLERILVDRLTSFDNVTILRGVEYTGADEDDDGITVMYQHVQPNRSAGGPPQAMPGRAHVQIRAQYLVGCDGSNSTVRTSGGFAVTDLGFFYDWFIVDVVLLEPREFHPTNLQICDPARPTTAVSGGPGRRRWEFMVLPTEAADDFKDEVAAWRLLQPWDVTPDNARLERHALYTFQARWVDIWRHRRVMLAGDAAHQMPPFAGQGMCAGIRDAANLAWKLDLVLQRQAPDALLDQYGIERCPSVEQAIKTSMDLGRVICIADPAAARERDTSMIRDFGHNHMIDLPPLPGIVHGIRLENDPLAGQIFPQARVATAEDGICLFDDCVGTGWRLITTEPVDATTLDPELLAWFTTVGGRVITVAPDGLIHDVDGVYTTWFDEHQVTTVLQRPDFYIFGSGTHPDSATALLHAARLALQPGHV